MKNLAVIENRGQRVLTTEQLALVYETGVKNISNNFNRNKERFEEGKHYYKLEGEELREFKAIHLKDESLKFASILYLWTERGANRHCKILDTDRAWDQFDNLEEVYFKVKEQKKLSPMEELGLHYQVLATHEEKLTEIGNRIDNIENNTTVDYGQQQELSKIARVRVMKFTGGKDSPAYKDSGLRSTIFSTMWNGYKDYFSVNSYKNTLRKDYNRATMYLRNWRPQGKLLREIEQTNGQMVM